MTVPSKYLDYSVSAIYCYITCNTNNLFLVPLSDFAKKTLIRFLSVVHKSFNLSLKARDQLLQR